jgi:hypothetical protein
LYAGFGSMITRDPEALADVVMQGRAVGPHGPAG